MTKQILPTLAILVAIAAIAMAKLPERSDSDIYEFNGQAIGVLTLTSGNASICFVEPELVKVGDSWFVTGISVLPSGEVSTGQVPKTFIPMNTVTTLSEYDDIEQLRKMLLKKG